MFYRLDLPPNSKIHPTFHVSYLKAKLGQHVVSIPTLTPTDLEGAVISKPVVVLKERSQQLRNRTITPVLVQWQGESPDDATWESLYVMQQRFPHLVGKVF